MSKQTNQIERYFKNTMNDNDAQKAEIQVIKAALEVINKTNIKDFTILCDCKNAVNYCIKIYRIRTKYAKLVQQIYTKLTKNNNNGTSMNVEWISGHTGNT